MDTGPAVLFGALPTSLGRRPAANAVRQTRTACEFTSASGPAGRLERAAHGFVRYLKAPGQLTQAFVL